MRICIIGAGAIGGYLALRLARGGAAVSVIARGAQLAAIRQHGLRVQSAAGMETARLKLVTDQLHEAGAQDLVILAMKAHQVEPILDGLPHLLHEETIIVPMQNGVPWWYFQRLPPSQHSAHAGRVLRAVDPQGALARGIEPRRIVGCVVYPACALVAPGVIRHIEGERFPLGEPDGALTPRVKALADVFTQAELKAPVLEDIRAEIWLKLWGNLTFNPISALTRAPLDAICIDPHTRGLAEKMMREAQAVAGKLGIGFRVPLEQRIAGAQKVGRHKTSMLQDIEAGRGTEIEALVGTVIELAHLTATPVPNIEAMYACTRLLQQSVCAAAAPAPAGAALAA